MAAVYDWTNMPSIILISIFTSLINTDLLAAALVNRRWAAASRVVRQARRHKDRALNYTVRDGKALDMLMTTVELAIENLQERIHHRVEQNWIDCLFVPYYLKFKNASWDNSLVTLLAHAYDIVVARVDFPEHGPEYTAALVAWPLGGRRPDCCFVEGINLGRLAPLRHRNMSGPLQIVAIDPMEKTIVISKDSLCMYGRNTDIFIVHDYHSCRTDEDFDQRIHKLFSTKCLTERYSWPTGSSCRALQLECNCGLAAAIICQTNDTVYYETIFGFSQLFIWQTSSEQLIRCVGFDVSPRQLLISSPTTIIALADVTPASTSLLQRGLLNVIPHSKFGLRRPKEFIVERQMQASMWTIGSNATLRRQSFGSVITTSISAFENNLKRIFMLTNDGAYVLAQSSKFTFYKVLFASATNRRFSNTELSINGYIEQGDSLRNKTGNDGAVCLYNRPYAGPLPSPGPTFGHNDKMLLSNIFHAATPHLLPIRTSDANAKVVKSVTVTLKHHVGNNSTSINQNRVKLPLMPLYGGLLKHTTSCKDEMYNGVAPKCDGECYVRHFSNVLYDATPIHIGDRITCFARSIVLDQSHIEYENFSVMLGVHCCALSEQPEPRIILSMGDLADTHKLTEILCCATSVVSLPYSSEFYNNFGQHALIAVHDFDIPAHIAHKTNHWGAIITGVAEPSR